MAFDVSPDTLTLKSVLREAVVGKVVTYEEMSKALGRDVRKFCYPNLNAARLSLAKTESIIFGTENGVGLRRLDDRQVVESSEKDVKKIRKLTGRSLGKLQTVDVNKLDEPTKKSFLTRSSQLGAVFLCSQNQAGNKIEGRVRTNSERVPVGEVLKMLSE